MRVLQLTQRFPPAIGGVEDHVFHLSRGLADRGVDVRVATTDLRRDVPFERLPAFGDGSPFLVRRHRARKVMDAPHGLGIISPGMFLDAVGHGADLLHAHAYGYFPTWVGAAAQSLDGASLVVTPHSGPGGDRLSKHLFDRVVPPLTLHRAARVIALTRSEAAYLETLGVPADRIAVVPNGVDLDEFSDIAVERPQRGSIAALFVGRLDSRQKGLEPLVHALARLPASAGVHLRLVGEDWGGAARVRSLARSLGVEDRLTIVGPLPRHALIDEYARADLLVLPSLFEPFGIVLLEAMAAGLPVVASRTGGIPEVVSEGETGLLVEPGDPDGLAAALHRLAEDPGLRARMGRRGRERSGSYSWDALIPQVLAVYHEALEERVR